MMPGSGERDLDTKWSTRRFTIYFLCSVGVLALSIPLVFNPDSPHVLALAGVIAGINALVYLVAIALLFVTKRDRCVVTRTEIYLNTASGRRRIELRDIRDIGAVRAGLGKGLSIRRLPAAVVRVTRAESFEITLRTGEREPILTKPPRMNMTQFREDLITRWHDATNGPAA